MSHVLETYPREELIEIATDDLMRIAKGIVMLQEHPRVRVFLRNDLWGRYVSAFVFMPRDRFDSSVRRRIVTLLSDSLKSDNIDFFVTLSESRLARLHLVARMPAGTRYDYDAVAFEHEVARIVRGWHDELQHNLVEHCGEARGNEQFDDIVVQLERHDSRRTFGQREGDAPVVRSHELHGRAAKAGIRRLAPFDEVAVAQRAADGDAV